MRLGTKAALLSAAISALSVSAVGSAHADDGPPAHTQESSPTHAENLHHFKKSHRVKHALFVDESSPAPLASTASPLCTAENTATGGAADAGGGTATGGAATNTGTITQTCNITVNLPVGSDQTVTRTSREFFLEEDRTEAFSKREYDRN